MGYGELQDIYCKSGPFERLDVYRGVLALKAELDRLFQLRK
jgi:hypothetical protein